MTTIQIIDERMNGIRAKYETMIDHYQEQIDAARAECDKELLEIEQEIQKLNLQIKQLGQRKAKALNACSKITQFLNTKKGGVNHAMAAEINRYMTELAAEEMNENQD